MVTMLPLKINNRRLKELISIKNHQNLACEHSSNNFISVDNKCTCLVAEPTSLPHKLGQELAPRITGPPVLKAGVVLPQRLQLQAPSMAPRVTGPTILQAELPLLLLRTADENDDKVVSTLLRLYYLDTGDRRQKHEPTGLPHMLDQELAPRITGPPVP